MEILNQRLCGGGDDDSSEKRTVDDDEMRSRRYAAIQNTAGPFCTQRRGSSMSPVSGQSPLLSAKRGIDDVSLLVFIGEKRRRIQKQLRELDELARKIQGRLTTHDHDPTNCAEHSVYSNAFPQFQSDTTFLSKPHASLLDRQSVQHDSANNGGEAAMWPSERNAVFPRSSTETLDSSRMNHRRAHLTPGNPMCHRSRADAAALVDTARYDSSLNLRGYPAGRVGSSSSRKREQHQLLRTTSLIEPQPVPRHLRQENPSHQGAASATVSPHLAITADMSMSMPSDDKYLSTYQVLVRKTLEFFVASDQDINTSQKGRKRKLRLHQIGIRCRYCAHLHPSLRTRGSSTYPRSKSSFYLSAQNIIMAHLVPPPTKCGSAAAVCHCLPTELAKALAEEKAKQSASTVGSGYWANEGCALDMVERDGAVWLA